MKRDREFSALRRRVAAQINARMRDPSCPTKSQLRASVANAIDFLPDAATRNSVVAEFCAAVGRSYRDLTAADLDRLNYGLAWCRAYRRPMAEFCGLNSVSHEAA